MKGSRITFLFWITAVATLLSFTATLYSPAWAKVTVGIIGDQFGVKGRVGTPEFEADKRAAYQALKDGVAALNRAGRMDTVLHVGDLIESTQDIEVIRSDFHQAAAILDQLVCDSSPAWFLAAGDHDINPLEWVRNSQDRSREALFRSLYRKIRPGLGDTLYYSFDVKGYHFVCLYTHEALRADPRWGNVFLARISDRQLAWLEKDLADAAGTRGVIVFLHQPLWYNYGAWVRVHEVLARHNTRAVVAGHFHYDQADHFSDGIDYRVVGALGGHVKNGDAGAGAWWHVSRLTLHDDDRLSWELIPVKGGPKDQFTDRWDMDRIQALDITLGLAVRNLESRAVYVKAGHLTDAAGTGPARITLSGFGNPVDQPVVTSIRIDPASPYRLISSRFEPDLCIQSAEDGTCRIRPAANIAYANTSTVSPACARYSPDYSRCLEYKPFWEGEVVYTGEGRPRPGDTVPVIVSMQLPSGRDGAPLNIWKKVNLKVRPFPGQ